MDFYCGKFPGNIPKRSRFEFCDLNFTLWSFSRERCSKPSTCRQMREKDLQQKVLNWGHAKNIEESKGPEVGKVFALESSWALLLQRCEGNVGSKDDSKPTKAYEIYRGHFAPQVRATDANNGEAIAMVLTVFEFTRGFGVCRSSPGYNSRSLGVTRSLSLYP